MKEKCDRCGERHPGCNGHSKTTGAPCRVGAVPGADVCWRHGGRAPQVVARAAVRRELMDWGVNDDYVDPAQTMLRLLAQSTRRAEFYSVLLERAFQRKADVAADDALAGLAALIGHRYGITKDGDRLPLEEAVRALPVLEAEERERAFRFAKLAHDAGLAQRRIDLEESLGRRIYQAFTTFIDMVLAAGVPEEYRQVLVDQAPAALVAIEGGSA